MHSKTQIANENEYANIGFFYILGECLHNLTKAKYPMEKNKPRLEILFSFLTKI